MRSENAGIEEGGGGRRRQGGIAEAVLLTDINDDHPTCGRNVKKLAVHTFKYFVVFIAHQINCRAPALSASNNEKYKFFSH